MKKVVCLLFALLLTFTSIPVTCSALLYHKTDAFGLIMDTYTPRLTEDPYWAEYYITTSNAFSLYINLAIEGLEAWYSYEDEIDPWRTTNYDESSIDIKGYNGDSLSYIQYRDRDAFTKIYCGTGPYGDNVCYQKSSDIDSDYWLGEIYLNYASCPTEYLGMNSYKNKVRWLIAHEYGHVLGFGHTDSNIGGDSMSCNYITYWTTLVSNAEKTAIRNLYDYR